MTGGLDPVTMRSLRVPAAILIGLIWAAAFLVGMVTRDYLALGITTPAVMIVVGAIFTRTNGNGIK